MGPYTPNFEHLVYAIELLEDYTDVFRLPDNKYKQTIENFGRLADLPNPVEAYSAASYALLPITLDSRRTNPISSQVSIKGASAKYMWVAKAIRRLIADKISTSYTLDHLKTFEEVFCRTTAEYTIATTNYDLVFEEYLSKAGIEINDGFSIDSEPSEWRGIFEDGKRITFLKLHGSLNWFKVRQEWFKQIPRAQSSNDIYKMNGSTCKEYLKYELADKGKSDIKHKYEFDIPHIILGGNKDSKILDTPYIDIHRQWLSDLSVAKTIVLVGVSGYDYHLLQQMRGLITTNPNLEKILLVNPDWSSHERISSFVDMKRIYDRVKLFHVECGWDLSSIKEQYKMSFSEMVHMSSSRLHAHYTKALNAGK